MKRFSFILGIAAGLLAGTGSVQAGHCGSGFYLGIWPFVSIGFGVGVGASCSYPHPAYGCGYYGYPSCGYSSHSVSASSAPAASTHATTIAAAPVQERPSWTPTTPPLGHWVPDPQPYTFDPSATAIVRKSTPVTPAAAPTMMPAVNQTPAKSPTTTTTSVTLTKTPSGIPTYIVSSPRTGPNS